MNLFDSLPLLAQYESTTGGESLSAGEAAGLMAFMAAYAVVVIGIGIFFIVCMWKIYTKAGKPGWASIIPIYNMVVWLEMVGRPTWWVVLMFIPGVNIVIGIIITIDLAKSFGKDGAYAAGLILLGFIFFPMLAFGSAQYQGPAAAEGAVAV